MMAVLASLGVILNAFILFGGATFGAGIAWFILGAMEVGPLARTGGTVAAGLVSGFLTWAILNIAALLHSD